MTKPIKWALCHPDRLNYDRGKCKECHDYIHDLNAPCIHHDRKKDIHGRCSSCMGRYYSLRREKQIGDKFGTIRTSRTLHFIKDPELRRRLVARKRRIKQYGLDLDDYEKMLEQQNGVCDICKQPPKTNKDLTVDHDHRCCSDQRKSCGKCVRGLLCHGCNMRLGQLESDLVMRSLEYLKLYEEKKCKCSR